MKQGIDHIGLGVGGIIINNGKVFAALRGKGVRNQAGTWEFPGGGVEFGETATQTICRETMEEFGITVSVTQLLGYIDFIHPEEQQHWVGLHFACNYLGGEGEIREKRAC